MNWQLDISTVTTLVMIFVTGLNYFITLKFRTCEARLERLEHFEREANEVLNAIRVLKGKIDYMIEHDKFKNL